MLQNPHKDVWEGVYKEHFMTMWQPPDGTVQFTARFIKKRLTLDQYQEFFPAQRVLDIGCGNGAAVGFFSKLGYEAHGVDLSEFAIELGQEHLKRENLRGELKVADARSLPYPDNYFDVVTSFGVFDHMEPDHALRAAHEVYRVLKNPGLFFVTLIDTRTSKYGQGKQVAKNAFVLEGDWYEAGAVQYYYDKQDIENLLHDKFKIKDARLTMQKKLSPSLEDQEWNYRWHLTTEKI